jgi:FkbM family methyltransferase
MMSVWLRVLFRKALPESWALRIRQEWLVRQIARGAAWSEGEVALLPRFVKPTDVCWDIGANCGMYTVPLARLARKVCAFEPVPHNRQILSRVVQLSGVTNVEMSPVAISDTRGAARMSVPTGVGFYGGYYMAALDEDGTIEVSTDTVDGIIAQGSPEPDFIKCDVEGSEIRVIHGARDLIARRHPIWLLESFDDHVWPLMESFGYSALMNTRDGRIHPSPARVSDWRNYWFVPSERAARFEGG